MICGTSKERLKSPMILIAVLVLSLFTASCGSSGSGDFEWPPEGATAGIAGSGARITAWDQLPRMTGPAAGYGLYSFILFSREPTSEIEKNKYLKTLEYLVGTTGSAEFLSEAGYDRRQINITYVPVLKPQSLSGLSAEARAKRLLALYDYEFADMVLAGFDRPLTGGPYFVSMKDATDLISPAPGKVVMQDLTATTQHNVGAWVEAFVARARRRDYAKEDAVAQLLLELRNGLSVVAELGPGVIDGVNSLVDWLAPKAK